ncbi:MAG: DUF4142 domain-containing protein [Verrucomicrobiia bacterium]
MNKNLQSIPAKCLGAALLAAVSVWGGAAIAADHSSTHSSSAESPRQADNKEAEFIKKAAKGGKMEIQIGKLAAQNGQNPQVKQFGQTLQQDHSKANQELMQVAQTLGVALPTASDRDEHKDDRSMDKLTDKTGAEFDKAFAEHALKDHQKDITEYQEALQDAKNPQLKAYIQKTLPVLHRHLQTAHSIGKDVGVDEDALTAASQFLSRHQNLGQGLGTGAGAESGRGSQSDSGTLGNPGTTRDLDDNDR